MPVMTLNDPITYRELSEKERAALSEWIQTTLSTFK